MMEILVKCGLVGHWKVWVLQDSVERSLLLAETISFWWDDCFCLVVISSWDDLSGRLCCS
jgi:hypothetical protein